MLSVGRVRVPPGHFCGTPPAVLHAVDIPWFNLENSPEHLLHVKLHVKLHAPTACKTD